MLGMSAPETESFMDYPKFFHLKSPTDPEQIGQFSVLEEYSTLGTYENGL